MPKIKIKAIPEAQKRTVSSAVEDFLRHCRIRNLSPRTVEYYGEDLNYFIENADASGMTVLNTTYQGLPLFTVRNMLSPEQEMVMRCTVTTAPGVNAEPEIIRTPTLTESRLAYLESNG